MLATKGVRNETPPLNVQFLHQINEDTDHIEYKFANGEIPPAPSHWTGDVPPPQVYTMAKPSLEAAISPLDVAFSDDADSDSEIQPIQLDTQNEAQISTPEIEEKGPAQTFPTIVSLPTPEPLPRPKPTWWSEAWEMLDGIQSESQLRNSLTPMSGEEFRLKCGSDVHAIDLYCSRSVIDPITGESRLADEQDDERQVVTGVMWSDEAITKSVVYGKGRDPNELDLLHLKKMLDACPADRAFTLHTSSEFLLVEGEKFRELVESGSLGEVWNQIHGHWKNIWGHMSIQGKMLGIMGRSSEEFPQRSVALRKHSQERIQKMEACAREGSQDDDPGEPPSA
jgi:hypothetical protein